jgi:hypothetical protein
MKRIRDKSLYLLLKAIVLCGLVPILLAAGCGGGTPEPSDRVRRWATEVWAGSPAANPPLLTDNDWEDLHTDDGISTDDDGEAEVQLIKCDGSLWVFKNSKFSVYTCRKAAEQSGSWACVEAGTAGFNIDCATRFIVDTPSAQVTILATAFSVTYVPEARLTLVTVHRGLVELEPVLNVADDTLGPALPVKEGQFLYTMPGAVSPEIAGVPARRARPLQELPPLVDELRIRPWMDDIARRMEEQQVLPPSWPFGPESVMLRSGGGLLEDRDLQEALLTAIDKERAAQVAFPDQELLFNSVLGGNEIDARSIGYDPERAQAMVEELGYFDQLAVALIFPEGDRQLSAMALVMASDLKRAGIGVELVAVPVAEMEELARKRIDAGEPTVALLR